MSTRSTTIPSFVAIRGVMAHLGRFFILVLLVHSLFRTTGRAYIVRQVSQNSEGTTEDMQDHDPNAEEDGAYDNELGQWTVPNVTRLTESLEEVIIAYFVQISSSSLLLVPRLLARIHHPLNKYALHFDQKIPLRSLMPIHNHIVSNPKYKNVHIMKRESVTYRGVSMILNTLAAVEDLLALGEWHYFINLSGSDYPLVSPHNQRRLLGLPYVRERAANFFTTSSRSQWNTARYFRLRHIAVDGALGSSPYENDSKLHLLPNNNPLFDRLFFEYVKGEGWVILTREACSFLLKNSYARKMLVALAYSQDPSEHFYVSVFWNDPVLNQTIIPHSLRTIYWKLNGVYSGQHPYVMDELRDPDGSYTVWKWLRRSPHFFARKFSDPDANLLDKIDNEMNGLGTNINSSAVAASLQKVERHLHWIFGFLSRSNSSNESSLDEEWPRR